jgi:hypothetical protein
MGLSSKANDASRHQANTVCLKLSFHINGKSVQYMQVSPPPKKKSFSDDAIFYKNILCFLGTVFWLNC